MLYSFYKPLKSFLVFVAIVSYPIIIHLNVIGSNSIFAAVLAISIMLLATWITIKSGFFVAAVILSLVSAGAAFILYKGTILQVLYLPPVVVNVCLCSFFASSLRSGHTPLITRYAVLIEGDIGHRKREYTRSLTKVWVLFFALIAIESTLLAIFAAPEIWSLFTNFINYMLALFLFLGEYLLRKKILPDQEHLGFTQFFRRLGKIKVRNL